MMKLKKGDVVRISKSLLRDAVMHPSGIQKLEDLYLLDEHRLLHSFKENETGIVISGPYDDLDFKLWELFVDNKFWLVDEIYLNLIDESEQREKI